MDLLKIIKRYRSDKDPKLQEFDGKCLSTFSREDLLQVVTNIKLHLNDILVLLDIDDSRENLCKVLSFALEQKDELKEDTVTQEPRKKKAKTSENKSSGAFYAERMVQFYAERDGSGFYAERKYCSGFMSNVNRETERKKYFDLFCLGMVLGTVPVGSERKKDDEVMKTLEDKIADLEKKLEKKQADDELSEFERAKRDVKDEAAKGKLDIDVLNERLILLDNLARKQNHDLKEKNKFDFK
ncbi:unnamed protein product [Mytilus coruscus]|uniref:Uncharacterized protein n=1 Tax=Mytilus coruscus TaxID=42192 RepID=A0A6J8C550_MYTCO|nr:unnamed protein product [Mytilus coruscus]